MKQLTRWLTWLALAGFVWFIYNDRANLHDWWKFTTHISWWWVAVMVAAEGGYYLCHGVVYQSVMAVVGLRTKYWEMVTAALMVLYLNTSLPTLGIAGAEPVLEVAARRQQSAGRAATAYVMASTVEVATLALLAAIFLFITSGESIAWLASWRLPIACLLVIGVIIVALTITISRDAALANELILFLQRPINWVRRQFGYAPLKVGWTVEAHQGLVKVARDLTTHPAELWWAVLWGLAAHISEALLFISIFHAIGQPIPLDQGLLIYYIMMLVWFVSPTPQGIGIVEIISTAALGSIGIPAATAIAVPLIFRGFAHWLPAITGFVLYTRRPALPSTGPR